MGNNSSKNKKYKLMNNKLEKEKEKEKLIKKNHIISKFNDYVYGYSFDLQSKIENKIFSLYNVIYIQLFGNTKNIYNFPLNSKNNNEYEIKTNELLINGDLQIKLYKGLFEDGKIKSNTNGYIIDIKLLYNNRLKILSCKGKTVNNLLNGNGVMIIEEYSIEQLDVDDEIENCLIVNKDNKTLINNEIIDNFKYGKNVNYDIYKKLEGLYEINNKFGTQFYIKKISNVIITGHFVNGYIKFGDLIYNGIYYEGNFSNNMLKVNGTMIQNNVVNKGEFYLAGIIPHNLYTD